jgi:transposase
MSETLLQHALGLKCQEIMTAEYGKQRIDVHIRTKAQYLTCAECGSKNVLKKGYTERCFLTAPIGSKTVHLIAQIQRLECRDCGLIRQEHIGYADPKKSYTHFLEEYMDDLLETISVAAVASRLGMSWNTVKGIQTRNEKTGKAKRNPE